MICRFTAFADLVSGRICNGLRHRFSLRPPLRCMLHLRLTLVIEQFCLFRATIFHAWPTSVAYNASRRGTGKYAPDRTNNAVSQVAHCPWGGVCNDGNAGMSFVMQLCFEPGKDAIAFSRALQSSSLAHYRTPEPLGDRRAREASRATKLVHGTVTDALLLRYCKSAIRSASVSFPTILQRFPLLPLKVPIFSGPGMYCPLPR